MFYFSMPLKSILLIITVFLAIALITKNTEQSIDSNTENNYTSKGYATIQDGDSLKINNVRHRLLGIDAPELDQNCEGFMEKKYPCGRVSKEALAKLVENKIVECTSDHKDRYERLVAVCYVDNTDINGWLVENGFAEAYRRYSDDYIKHEEKARALNKGIWRGSFISPAKYRRQKSQNSN